MKRSAENDEQHKSIKKDPSVKDNQDIEPQEDMGEFEDPYGDDFESEDEIFEAGDDDENSEESDAEMQQEGKPATKEKEKAQPKQRVYLPHRSAPLGENEVMEPDYSTYNMLHSTTVNWPHLSFDIVPDTLGDERRSYPKTVYAIAGSQASKAKENEISVLKFSSLCKTLVKDSDSDDDDDENDDVDATPVLESRVLPTNSTTNRIRVSPFSAVTDSYLAASMAENGNVYVWDFTPHMHFFERGATQIPKAANKPTHVIQAHHNIEGYGLDWSPLIQTGALLSGDNVGKIFLTQRSTSGWSTESQPFLGCTGSVEDIQWSPSERTVFAAGGSDGHIRVWDTRQKEKTPALSGRVSESDVNVISWNKRAAHLMASGHDDGSFSVWDFRTFSSGKPVANFAFHKAPITTIEFNPLDESVLSVGSEDNTVTLWDLSVEVDDEEIAQQHSEAQGELDDIPSQLLFVHWQPNVKEVHWHKQIPGTLMSTGSDGFSIWNTISI